MLGLTGALLEEAPGMTPPLEVGIAGMEVGVLEEAAPAPAGVLELAGQSVTVGSQEVMVTSSVR
jgi:hypothetical protein